MLLISATLLVIASGLFYFVNVYSRYPISMKTILTPIGASPTTVVNPTQQPTVITPSYPNAHTIINALKEHNLLIQNLRYGVSIEDFYGVIIPGLYSNVMNIPYVDSVMWDTQHPEDCSPCFGLWIYSSNDIAFSVYQKLIEDSLKAQDNATPRRYRYPNPSVYGHCVVDGGGLEYIAIIHEYCI